MSFHTVIVSLISILATFIQTEFQTKSSSLFETHGWIMYTFYVLLFIYAVAGVKLTVQAQAQNAGNEVLTKVALLAGALASIMLLLIIRPVLGWVALAFWTLSLLKIIYDQVDAFVQLLQTLNNAFLQAFQSIKNAFLQAFQNIKNAFSN